MNSSAQYSALTRLLSHNTRVYQLEELLRQLPARAPVGVEAGAGGGGLGEWEEEANPIADLQNDIDKEVRASLVACWFAMPRELEDLEEV